MIKTWAIRVITWWFRRSGWIFTGPLPKTLKHCVIVVAPHTSRKDFFLAIAVCHLAKFRSDIMVRETYFRFPIKRFLHQLGARPYAHQSDLRLKNWIVKNIRSRPQYSVVLTTRLLSDDMGEFRTLWYDIALETGIPIVPVFIDSKRRHVKIHSHFVPSVSRERDLHFVQQFFQSFHSEEGAN